MLKEGFIQQLQDWKRELVEDIIPLHQSGNTERGRLAFGRWKERFRAFLEENTPSEVNRFVGTTTHVVGFAFPSESQYQIFMRQDGQPCLAFIDDLAQAVSKGYVDLQEAIAESSDRANNISTVPPSPQPIDQSDEMLVELTRIKDCLDQYAEGYARKTLILYLSFLIFIWASLIVLTLIYGWEKLEPWTFFIGVLPTLISYFYFVITKQEFSPKAIYEQFTKSIKTRIYQRFGFDLQKYHKFEG